MVNFDSWDIKTYIQYRLRSIFDIKIFKKPLTWVFILVVILNLILWRTNLSNIKNATVRNGMAGSWCLEND